MSEKTSITVMETRGLQVMVRCDFCGNRAEYVWMLFQSADGKNHVCSDCVSAMWQAICDAIDEQPRKVDV